MLGTPGGREVTHCSLPYPHFISGESASEQACASPCGIGRRRGEGQGVPSPCALPGHWGGLSGWTLWMGSWEPGAQVLSVDGGWAQDAEACDFSLVTLSPPLWLGTLLGLMFVGVEYKNSLCFFYICAM